MVRWNRRRALGAPAWPSARELRLKCARLAAEVPEFHYGGCLFSLHSIHSERNPVGRVIKPHRHSHYEVVLILEGEADELTPPNNRLTVGTLQLHGPGDLHAWSAPDRALLRLGIWVTAQPKAPVRPPARWPRNPGLCRQVRELLAETDSTAPGRRERLAARLTLLLAPALALLDLPGLAQTAVSTGGDDAPGIASFVERFLADNLAEPLELEDVAAQFNLSVPTLTRRFRRETGESVMARLQGMRLRHAAELLRAGVLSVKEVGVAVGIPEPSYFGRCFRRAFGASPGRFKADDGPVRP